MTNKAQDANSLSLAFNRRVSADLESALNPGGLLRPPVDLALADSEAKSCRTSEVEPRINVDDGLHLSRFSRPAGPQIRRSLYPIFHPIYRRGSRGRSATVSD